MRKYEYKYIEVNTRGLFADDYKEIIDEQVEEGWRFVTSIDRTSNATSVVSKTLDLVFEREIETENR